MSKDDNLIVEGVTCFSEHRRRNLTCEKCACRLWFDNSENLNCAIIASEDGPRTLHDVGTMFGITRMRVCQIEKDIREKCKLQITLPNPKISSS